jgi:thiol-disulfide isomerase/thioredoxin
MNTRNKLTLGLSVAIILGLTAGRGALTGWAASRGTVVLFNANWCASCREVNPIVQDVASQNNLGYTQIDVDAQTAPKEAHNYGLSIPNDGPPQVYYVDRGHATMLYNGKDYKFGYGDAARATILRNLQQVLK